MSPALNLVSLIASDSLRQAVDHRLVESRYHKHWSSTEADFLDWVGLHKHHIDCLLIEQSPRLNAIFEHLVKEGIFLPTIVVSRESSFGVDSDSETAAPRAVASETGDPKAKKSQHQLISSSDGEPYHTAVTQLLSAEIEDLDRLLQEAINRFLELPAVKLNPVHAPEEIQNSLLDFQQQRLTNKLRERLGYLGVYYKRNPDQFLRNMSQSDQKELLQQLRQDYRIIILNYFAKDQELNKKIDNFVNLAFFADVSVSQIVEIHMDLMDNFSKQLKLEGRSEEILLDYRLTLIDVIAHLCEMYRRSIPRET